MNTNLDILIWGIKHIAENHNLNASIDYEEDGTMCIWGGCNVPTLTDVEMLCEDIKLPQKCIETSEFGIDIVLTMEWYEEFGKEPYQKGLEMWKRANVAIA